MRPHRFRLGNVLLYCCIVVCLLCALLSVFECMPSLLPSSVTPLRNYPRPSHLRESLDPRYRFAKYERVNILWLD
jgi:hypothetical protein